MKKNKHLFALFSLSFFLFFAAASQAQNPIYKKTNTDLLANGKSFPFWEKKQKPTKTYYVDQNHNSASDQNPGTEQAPFKTINRAAQVLKPGEEVIIKAGTYRESIHPLRGGASPEKMIVYKAAAGEKVIVKGSVVLPTENWQHGKGWRYGRTPKGKEKPQVWQFDFDGKDFGGYNPFAMMNIQHDREWLQYKKVNMQGHFKRRGMIFLNGKPIEQVEKPIQLAAKDSGAFWIEHNGMRVHVRFPGNTAPKDWAIEATTKEQVFAPKQYGLGYIKLKGISFQHCGNGFPVPQRGMISASRGHHWVIEDCTIEWANSLGIDLGNEMWHTTNQPLIGFHVLRRNTIRHCGISGLQAMRAKTILVEDNLFDHIGWHDAEHGFESGGIKFHRAENTLIRRNVFRNITYAPGIWLDYKSNKNCRVTQNVFTDITTARGAIYVEVSHSHCLIDHNVFHKLRSQYWISGDYGAGGSAFYTDGSDSIDFEHNIAFDIENTGYGSYWNAQRIVGKRGGISRWHSVKHNIFSECRKHAIEFPHIHNFSDANVFSRVKAGYLKIANPEPALLLDIETWRKLYGWEKNGKIQNLHIELDSQKLELSIKNAENNQKAGPFASYKNFENKNIDPRKKK